MNNKLRILISLLILSLAIYIKVSEFQIVEQLQLKVFDSFQKKYPREYNDNRVKIIDIDDKSLAIHGQWPWPRNKLAKLIDRLNKAGVLSIGMDMVFAEEDRTSPKHILELWNKKDELSKLIEEIPDHDELFAKSINNAYVVNGYVLENAEENNEECPKEMLVGYSFSGEDPCPYLTNHTEIIANLPMLEESATGAGAFNSKVDEDGIIRRVPMVFKYRNILVPSLSIETLRVALGAPSYTIKAIGAGGGDGEISFLDQRGIIGLRLAAPIIDETGKEGYKSFEIPTDKQGNLWIHFTEDIPQRYVPAWKVLDTEQDISELEGKIVFIGTSSKGLKDIRATPLNQLTNGVELHVQAVEQILESVEKDKNTFLTRPDLMDGIEIVIMVITGLIIIVVMSKLSALWGAVFTFASLSGSLFLSWHMFSVHKILVEPVTPGIAIALVYISESLIRFISTENEKKQVRNAFSHYMSPALVEQLAKNPDSLQLGGETKELTLLFCDIRGFTTISEQFDAHSLTHFINQFLTPMTTIILDKHGTIDKYMGDCIMAFWNAPLDDEEHAKHGCISALKMLDALDELNEQQEIEAKDAGRKFIPINIGIGLNTGDCCVGNMGSDQRFDYSVLGDDVNLASRLEGQSKTYGVSVVIGENTQKKVSDLATMELDLIQVKGKTEPVRIFTLLGEQELKESNSFKLLSDNFNKMLKEYRSQNWEKAKSLLNSCKEEASKIKQISINGLFELYESRIKEFEKNNPPKDWDGVFITTSK